MGKTRQRGARAWPSRRRWTAEEARGALAAAEQSGLSLSEFASKHRLTVHRLSRWQRRLEASTTPEPLAFEELPRSQIERLEGTSVGERFEVVLRSGRVVRVSESFNAEALRRLLSVVDDEGAAC